MLYKEVRAKEMEEFIMKKKYQRNIEAQKERNINSGRPLNDRLPWTLEDLRQVCTMSPTMDNKKYLAKVLQRSTHAIQYVWCDFYRSIKSLKEQDGGNLSEYHQSIVKLKREIGPAFVYTPQKASDQYQLENDPENE